jgi:hypothetical protein
MKNVHRYKLSSPRALLNFRGYKSFQFFLNSRTEVSGELRKIHNEELHNLYSILYIIKMVETRMRRGGI